MILVGTGEEGGGVSRAHVTRSKGGTGRRGFFLFNDTVRRQASSVLKHATPVEEEEEEEEARRRRGGGGSGAWAIF